MSKKDIAAAEILVQELLQFVAKATSSKYGVSQRDYEETKSRVDNVFKAWYNDSKNEPEYVVHEESKKRRDETSNWKAEFDKAQVQIELERFERDFGKNNPGAFF